MKKFLIILYGCLEYRLLIFICSNSIVFDKVLSINKISSNIFCGDYENITKCCKEKYIILNDVEYDE